MSAKKIAAALIIFMTGCGGPRTGREYLVTPVAKYGYEGKVLAVDYTPDGRSSGILPTYIPTLKGTLLDIVPSDSSNPDGVYEPRYKFRVSDGPHEGEIVGFYAHMVELTPVR